MNHNFNQTPVSIRLYCRYAGADKEYTLKVSPSGLASSGDSLWDVTGLYGPRNRATKTTQIATGVSYTQASDLLLRELIKRVKKFYTTDPTGRYTNPQEQTVLIEQMKLKYKYREELRSPAIKRLTL